MIEKLRGKIVAMTMGVLCLLVVLANCVAHFAVIRACGDLTEQMLQALAESAEGVQGGGQITLADGPLLGTLTLDSGELVSLFNMPLYGLELDRDGQVIAFTDFQGRAPELDREEMAEVFRQIGQRENGGGKVQGFHYYKVDRPGGAYVAMTDSRKGLEPLISRHLARGVVTVLAPILLVLLGVSIVLSRLVLRPTVAVFDKQKQFISDAGHELKTPLSAIGINAAVLEEETGKNKYLDCIRAEARRMEGLVRQLLDVARLDGDGPPAARNRFSLTETVYQATLPFESMAFEQNIRYGVNLQPDCFSSGDPERIRQLMAILLDNAFKYGASGGEVSVRLRREGRRAVIEVYNTGRGIPKADLPHIFERFYRCDRSRPGNGSYGLGLAIARSIVQGCRGTLSAESEYGAWARFRVTL